jgi:hypothetical protein
VEPQYQLPQATLTKEQRLGLLQERFLRGEVTEETYKELKAQIEAHTGEDITKEDLEEQPIGSTRQLTEPIPKPPKVEESPGIIPETIEKTPVQVPIEPELTPQQQQPQPQPQLLPPQESQTIPQDQQQAKPVEKKQTDEEQVQ